jgi:hypothetical protein
MVISSAAKLNVMPFNNNLEHRQRWMLYPIYIAGVLLCLYALLFLVTLNETREFIGEKGVEYCWEYGSFNRYLLSHLISISIALGLLSTLYALARRNNLFAYVGVWIAWLLIRSLLSFFNLSFC